MEQLFILSKENLELAKAEVLALYNTKKYLVYENILILDSNKDFSKRLAYTHETHQVLFKTSQKNIVKDFEKYDWQSIYKKSFSIRSTISGINDKEYAKYIWQNVKNPKVDLGNAQTRIHLFGFKKQILICLLINITDKSFKERIAIKNPAPHPTGMNPKLSIACINLTGKTKGKLLDPFCGAGGLLIEAGLLGYKTIGYDINQAMLNRAKINLDHYKIKDYRLKINDATKKLEKADLVVTDLPYGKNSQLDEPLEDLAKKFFKKLYESTDAAVILVPDFLDYKKTLGKFKTKHVFGYYLHKSLSKKILVLNK